MKEKVTNKQLIECETIEIPQTFGVVMTNNTMVKKDNLGDFIILCTIGVHQFSKALCDLGASINLMDLKVFNKLGIEEPNPTNMRLLIVDRSIKKK